MKRILFFAALILGVVSCQKDANVLDASANGEASVTLNVSLSEVATRAAGKDSAKGGLANVDLTKYDIRYILEVYDKDGNLAKERMVNCSDEDTTSFTLRLIPGRTYSFVVWADFINAYDAQGKALDLHYDTSNGLKNIAVIDTKWDAIDESRDAYTDVQTIEKFNSSSKVEMKLTRPFAKLRIVTNDIKELFGVLPTEVTVQYYNTKIYNAFNALTKVASGEQTNKELTVTLSADTYTDETLADNGVQTLFADYLLGAEDDRVMFTFDAEFDGVTEDFPQIAFNTNIPVKRNHLTTIYGPILTDSSNVTVTIDANFDNGTEWNPEDDKYDVAIWDGKSTKEPKKDSEGNYIIKLPSELAWLADQVNGVTRAAANTFKGETFKLTKDIDLGGERWTPIGATGKFLGTFDGQNHTIANLVVSEEDKTPVGLFANGRVIKNIKVVNAEISGHYKAGVIVGDGLCAQIDNCHVENAIVKITTLNDNEANHAGGIVGYLSAETVAYVTNSSVKNAEIYAFRDVAGIAGCANGASVVTGNTVENVTVVADQTPVYKNNNGENEEKDGNAAAIAGRVHANATIEPNTIGANVVVIRKVDSTKEFEAALKDRRNEDVIYVGEGEVVLPASLAVSGINKLTIEGLDAKAAVQFNSQAGGADGGLNCYADGTELIFKNIKVVSPNTGSAYSGGFGRAKSVLFDNCYYEGQYRSMSYVKFYKCTIDPKTSYIYTDYSDADFVECIFNCSEGKGIQVYNDGNTTNTTINVTDCTFTAAKHGQTWDKKPVTAIDINSNGEKFTVNINNTTATGFPEGEYSGETLYNIKGGAEHVTIKIDGYVMFPGRKQHDETGLYWNGETKPHKQRFYVHNAEELAKATAYFAGQNHSNEANVVTIDLVNDIDLAGVEWNPWSVMFITVNGNNHTISNLSNSFFGYAGAVTVNNLTLENVTASGNQAGTFAASAEGAKFFNCFLKGNNKVTFVDNAKVENGVGAISGITINSNLNVTITEGTNVEVDMNTISNTEKTTFDNILTGYKHTVYATNSGTITNNGNVSVKVAKEIVANSEGTGYSGELFEEGATDFFVLQNSTLTDDAKITLKRTYKTVALEGVTADINDNLIVAEEDNTIILHDCDITLAEGKKLIVTVGGAKIGQVMIHNVKVNGEMLTQQSAANFMEGVNWYQVW